MVLYTILNYSLEEIKKLEKIFNIYKIVNTRNVIKKLLKDFLPEEDESWFLFHKKMFYYAIISELSNNDEYIENKYLSNEEYYIKKIDNIIDNTNDVNTSIKKIKDLLWK